MVVGKDILSGDDSFEGTVGGVGNAHVTTVIDSELLKDTIELVMN